MALSTLTQIRLFSFSVNTQLVFLLVYVDDIIITGNNTGLLNKVIHSLAHRFSLKDLGDLNFFLGVEVLRTKTGLILSQRKYITDLLHKHNMSDAKGVHSPLSTMEKLCLNDGSSLTNPSQYRQVIGSLQYLSLTRPDISYAVNRLSQFMHRPTVTHWSAAKRVLRYLKQTIGHGLLLRRSSSMTLHAFSDADWVGNADDSTSTTAYVTFLGANPVSWSSKKQRTVARSSTEAEYRAVAAAVAEVNWLQNLLQELHFPVSAPPTIYCDNVGTTYLCQNPVFHSRMKHIKVDFHFVRSQVQNKQLRVVHVHSADQLADSLTKPLSRQQHQTQCLKIGVVDTTPILRGHNKASAPDPT